MKHSEESSETDFQWFRFPRWIVNESRRNVFFSESREIHLIYEGSHWLRLCMIKFSEEVPCKYTLSKFEIVSSLMFEVVDICLSFV
jgi:hypothetical protein